MEAASPVYTPAVLQGEPPPWAHPTPSPSPMIRIPGGHDGMGLRGGGAPEQSFLLPEEALWGICEPYIQEMILALQREIQKAAQALLDQSRVDGSPSQMPTRPGMGGHGGPLSQVDAGNSMPFGSLLGNRAVPCEPLHEEAETLSAHEVPSGGSSNSSSPRMPGIGEGFTQKIAFHRTSNSVSPAIPAAPGPSTGPTGGSHRTSPAAQGLEPSGMRAVLLADSGASPVQQASGPCYVMPSEQNQRQTPTLSPQIPLAHLQGYSASSIDALDGEKSVMVCRHWKSKGWCRLESGCKFLHPDSKRGTGVPPKKGSREGAVQASDGTPPGGAAAAGESARTPGGAAAAGESARTPGTRTSRRSGRGRNNRGQHAGDAAGPGDGHTPGAAPAHALAMQGAPPGGPGRNDEGRHDR